MNPPDPATAPRPGNLDSLHQVVRRLGEQHPLGETLDLIAQYVADLAAFDFCGIILPDDQWQWVRLAGSHRFPASYAARLSSMYLAPVSDDNLAHSPTQLAARDGEIRVLENVLEDGTFEPWRELAEEYDYRSLVSVPLSIRGSVIGVLNGYSRHVRRYDQDELATVQALAGQAALAVEMATLVERQHLTIAALHEANAELERQREVERRAHEIHLRLTDAALTGAGAEQITQVLADLVGRPVVTTDGEGAVVAVAGSAIDASEDTDASEDVVELASRALRQLADRGDREGTAARREKSTVVGRDRPAVIGHVRIGYELVGNVVALPGPADSLDLDLRAVEHAAVVLALDHVRQRVAEATADQLHADFLLDLVQGRGGDPALLAARAARHGLTAAESYRIMVVALESWDEYLRGRRPDEDEASRMRGQILRAVEQVAARRFHGALRSQFGDRLTIAAPERPGDTAEEFRSAFAAMVAAVREINQRVGLQAGLGPPARAVDEFSESHRGALRALHVLQRLGRPDMLLPATELGVMGLLLDSSRPEELRAMADRVLGPLLESDGDTGPLTETLFTYLDLKGDLRATAEKLVVHVNTVKYRLRRMQELCGLDLHDSSQLVEATLAQLVHRLGRGDSPDW